MNDPDMPPPPPTADPSGAPPPQASPVPDPNAPPQQPALTGGVSSEERTWAMIAHLSALAGWLTGGIGNIAGPLIVWLVKKDTMPFAASEAKEALNFNISWLLWFLILCAVTVPLMLLFIGLLLIPVLIIGPVIWTVFCIVGGIRANEGRPYRYPLTVRFIQ